jgi:hypothetical protein
LEQSVLTSELLASSPPPDYNNNSFSLHYIFIYLKSKIFFSVLAACALTKVIAGKETALSEEAVILLSTYVVL